MTTPKSGYKEHLRASDARLAAKLISDKPQLALTPGQICALCDGGQLLGGGVIEAINY